VSGKHYPQSVKAKMIAMREAGKGTDEIAGHFNASRRAVQHIVRDVVVEKPKPPAPKRPPPPEPDQAFPTYSVNNVTLRLTSIQKDKVGADN
jgi:hypothetical protein